MKHGKFEKGQAIVLIVFALIGLIAMVGLTVDGGMSYSDHRKAQNAADSAAYAAALAHARGLTDLSGAAQTIATSNGYNNNGSSNTVTTTIADAPSGKCVDTHGANIANSKVITVDITSTLNTMFAKIIGVTTITNRVTAQTTVCGVYRAPIFGGNAVVGLNNSTTNCSINTGNSSSAHWTLTDGGLFSNGCAYSSNTGSVTLNGDVCVNTVGTASNFTCMNTNQEPMPQSTIVNMLPPVPSCSVTLNPNGSLPTGTSDPADHSYRVNNNPTNFTFSNGVFCVSNFDPFDGQVIILNNATLYVTDMAFNLSFQGSSGGFSGYASTSGPYKGYYLVVAFNNSNPCTAFNGPGANNFQIMKLRGNGSGNLSGTFFAPTACIDFRGNSDGTAVQTQVIGYMVTSNGTADVNIQFVDTLNRQDPVYPTIRLTK